MAFAEGQYHRKLVVVLAEILLEAKPLIKTKK
jgi:hypothetical protein